MPSFIPCQEKMWKEAWGLIQTKLRTQLQRVSQKFKIWLNIEKKKKR